MYIFMAVLMILLILGLGIYGYYFVNSIFKALKLRPDKRSVKIINIILAIVIAISSANIFSFSSILMLHIIVLSVMVDLIWKTIKIVIKENKIVKIFNFIVGIKVIPILVTTILIVYGYYNVNNIVETNYSITTDKKFTIEEDGNYRIVLIADLHYGISVDDDEFVRICREISDKKPDIVALCGDIIDENTSKEKMQTAFNILSTIESKYGIYYVYGNHDRQLYNKNRAYTEEELAAYIRKCKITILQDEVYKVNDEFTIIGREDNGYSQSKNVEKRKSIKTLMEDVRKDSFVLVVDHQPKEYEENEKSGTDLLISGHTHGGQIWPANVLFNIVKFDDAVYGKTTSENGKFNAIVTSGIAGWGYPVKTASKAEYVVIDVTSK